MDVVGGDRLVHLDVEPRDRRSWVASATSRPTTSGTRTDPPSRPPARVSSPTASRATTSRAASSRPFPPFRRARVLGTRPVVGRGRSLAGGGPARPCLRRPPVQALGGRRLPAPPRGGPYASTGRPVVGALGPPGAAPAAPAAGAQPAVVSGPAGASRVVARRVSSTRRRRGAPMAAAKSERAGTGGSGRGRWPGPRRRRTLRDPGDAPRRRRHPAAQVLGDDLAGVALERRPAAHALPGHHPEGVDVGPPVDHPAPQHLGAQ